MNSNDFEPDDSSTGFTEDNLFRDTTFLQKIHRGEALLGLVAAVMGLLLLLVGGPMVILWWTIYAKPPIPLSLAILLGVAWAGLMVIEYCLLLEYRDALSRAVEPISFHAAFAMVRHKWLRPILVFWLAGHVILIPAFAESLVDKHQFTHMALGELIFFYSFAIISFLMASHAAHTFLLATIAALTGSKTIVHAVWRCRFAIDLLQLGLVWWLVS